LLLPPLPGGDRYRVVDPGHSYATDEQAVDALHHFMRHPPAMTWRPAAVH